MHKEWCEIHKSVLILRDMKIFWRIKTGTLIKNMTFGLKSKETTVAREKGAAHPALSLNQKAKFHLGSLVEGKRSGQTC